MPAMRCCIVAGCLMSWLAVVVQAGGQEQDRLHLDPIDLRVPPVSGDRSIRYDYDIAYVRAPRFGDEQKTVWPEVSRPHRMDPGADLVLLRPDGSEEVLVEGGRGAVTDPMVSFDGQWIYYAYFHDLTRQHRPWAGSDIYKIHVGTRKIVRLTDGTFTPNTGAADWASDYQSHEPGKQYVEQGLYNLGPCPLPDGKVIFTSNRNALRPPSSPGGGAPTLQLFVMDDSHDGPGNNVECIGHLNLAMALHPVVLMDGRVMFSSMESQGLRTHLEWALWSIHPDGTNWNPMLSAFANEGGAVNSFHFQTQLSDGRIVVEEYYVGSNFGMGTLRAFPPRPPAGEPAFGPAWRRDPRNPPLRSGRHSNGRPSYVRLPFSPYGIESLTPFAHGSDRPADPSLRDDPSSPRVGKFTHPSGAPDNHLLVVWTAGPAHTQSNPQADAGIYLIPDGRPVDEPAQMRRIRNDPRYNAQWPRAVVPYKRIYGIDEPRRIEPLANDGSLSPHLPEATPLGLVGTSSMYKRETFPDGVVPEGSVTAECPEELAARDPWKGLDAVTSHGNGIRMNWANQGADAGLYSNDEIHAVRLVVQEPTSDLHRRLFFNHGMERMRILGELPVRKFPDGEARSPAAQGQPLDPDGNPDTSFLARIPADVPFTFQTLDRHGLVLNHSQTWHQVRPGEKRVDCGGCHAHSQQPTPFGQTLAAAPGHRLFDLAQHTPLLTTKAQDESGRQWDTDDRSGLRYTSGPLSVEYHRDIAPILRRSCATCHTERDGKTPAGNLLLDPDGADVEDSGQAWPGAYYRLALDNKARFGHKPPGWDSWGYYQASRYVRKLQSRRSLLAWKIHGRRLDGFHNDDHPSESEPGAGDLVHRGEPLEVAQHRARFDIDYVGSRMPPPAAVQRGTAAPLSDEDRRTLVRWIDLGCPIDLDFHPDQPQRPGRGWLLDETRPTLAVTSPRPGANRRLDRILVGMHDYYTGLDLDTFQVTADFRIDGAPPGTNLAGHFQPAAPGVWQLPLAQPITNLNAATLSVSVKDRQGNVSQVERVFSVGKSKQ